MDEFERYQLIQERLIARTMQPYPKSAPVVAGSTPVVYFGNPIKSSVVTLGINPSFEEFQDKDKKTLPAWEKRLVDHETLNGDFREGLTREQAIEVVNGCNYYFERNPYGWFDEIEKVALAPIGHSYRNGSAAHLDVIQWATDPVWSKIENKEECKSMLEADADFLRFQLSSYGFSFVLMNGGTVIEQVKSLGLVDLEEVGSVSFGHGASRSKLWRGELGDKTFLGWNLNIQRHETTQKNKEELSQWIAEQYEGYLK